MKVLALEPYYGGSHKAFLDGLIDHSRHDWETITLPAHSWKWRMRHASITFADQVRQLCGQGKKWDMVFASDMMNIGEFRGLAPLEVAELPLVAYFHENQFTYPDREKHERDLHFAFTNFISAFGADQVWFNSAFHRDCFLSALRENLPRMPDYQPVSAIDVIESKSRVHPPGIDEIPSRAEPVERPLHILWAARWEHDKNPDDFFAALDLLESQGVDFRLNVLGEQFKDSPAIFAEAHEKFADRIQRWGFQPSREEYLAALHDSDIVVSTAHHEFFGIAVVEAIMAGARPLLPERLSYPEILSLVARPVHRELFFYDGTVVSLADRLMELATESPRTHNWQTACDLARKIVTRFTWKIVAANVDRELDRLHRRSPHRTIIPAQRTTPGEPRK